MQNNEFDDFYKHSINGRKGNVFTRLDALEKRLTHIITRSTTNYISQIINENKQIIMPSVLGGVADPTDPAFSGVIISPTGILLNDGITYSFAIIENGVVVQGVANNQEVVVPATYELGDGSVTIDSDGVDFNQTGDEIMFFDDPYLYRGVIGILQDSDRIRLLSYTLDALTNRLTNGDFEAGSLTGWTEVDTGTNIAISASGQGYGGGYAVKFAGAATNADYIQQTITSSPFGIVVSLRAKSAGYFRLDLTGGTVVQTDCFTDDEWMQYRIVVYGTTTTFRVNVDPVGGSPSDVFIDDIVVQSLEGTGTTSFASALEIAHNTVDALTHIFSVISPEGDNVLRVETNGSGKSVIINAGNQDLDTTIRGDSDSALFFVDGGENKVGIGTVTPSEKLDVVGNIAVSGAILGGGAPKAETNTNDIFRCDNPGGVSAFAGTIATLPGGATLTYNVTSGQEGAMVPVSTSQLAKMRLYNTTRGTSALISNCVTGTNTITLTANVPGAWQVGDVITIASQTVSGGGFSWVDLEITSGLTGKGNIFIKMILVDPAVVRYFLVHPFETYSAAKQDFVNSQVVNVDAINFTLLEITGNVFSVAWTGNPTVAVIRERGYLS